MRLVFASALDPKRAYTGHDQRVALWNVTPAHVCNRVLDTWTGSFETYGDGLTQHSPEMAVPYIMIPDYCLSAVAFAQANPLKAGALAKAWPSVEVTTPQILWVAKLADKLIEEGDGGRDLYANLTEMKTSRADKSHDLRWVKVPSWLKPSAPAAWDAFIHLARDRRHGVESSPRTVLERWEMMQKITDVRWEYYRATSPAIADILELGDVDIRDHIGTGIHALRLAVLGTRDLVKAGAIADHEAAKLRALNPAAAAAGPPGPELHMCASPTCPGLPYKASDIAHPCPQ